MNQPHDTMIAIIEAHRRGKPIQARYTPAGLAVVNCLRAAPQALQREAADCGGATPPKLKDVEGWMDCPDTCKRGFNFTHFEYRIKPEPPKPREFWLCPNPYQNGRLEVYPVEQIDGIGTGKPFPNQIHVREVLP